MTLPVVQFFVRDQSGNTLPSAVVTVTEAGAGLADLWEDVDGTIPIANPTSPDPDGFVQFYILSGIYDIELDYGSTTTVLENFEVGTARHHTDSGNVTEEMDDRYTRVITLINTGDGLQGGGDLSSDLTLEVDATVVRTSRDIATGDGLQGGGDLSADRSLSVDASVVRDPSTVVRNNRLVDTGDGLQGGGDLSADRSLSVDLTVVRTSRAINSGDGLTGGGDLSGDRTLAVDATVVRDPTTVVRDDREIIAGDGLQGGGDLTTDRTIDVDATVVRDPSTVVRDTRNINSGFGLDGGGDLSSDLTLSVNGDVATSATNVNAGDGLQGGGDLTSDVNLAVDSTVVRISREITAGSGLDGGGDLSIDRVFSVDSSVVRTSRTLTAGDGLNGGGDLSSDRSFAVDSTVLRTDAVQTVTGQKTFTTPVLISGGNPAELVVKGNAAGRGFVGTGALAAIVGAMNGPSDTAVGPRLEIPYSGAPDAYRFRGGDTSASSTWNVYHEGNKPTTGEIGAANSSLVLTAGDGLGGGGDLTANRAFNVDATVVRTTGAQSIGGVKTFTDIAKGVYPVAPEDLATVQFVLDTSVGNGLVPETRVLTAGDGLSGGGNLSADRAFAVDTTVVRTSRTLTAGDGISGGGDLSANRTFAVDSSVVRTSRSVVAGDGLSGGGALSADVTLNVDSSVVRTSRTIANGSGITGGGDLSANRTISVDSTVIRTTGSQTMSGIKTFSTPPSVPTPTANLDAANKQYVDTKYAGTLGNRIVNFVGNQVTTSGNAVLVVSGFTTSNINAGTSGLNVTRGTNEFTVAQPTELRNRNFLISAMLRGNSGDGRSFTWVMEVSTNASTGPFSQLAIGYGGTSGSSRINHTAISALYRANGTFWIRFLNLGGRSAAVTQEVCFTLTYV